MVHDYQVIKKKNEQLNSKCIPQVHVAGGPYTDVLVVPT